MNDNQQFKAKQIAINAITAEKLIDNAVQRNKLHWNTGLLYDISHDYTTDPVVQFNPNDLSILDQKDGLSLFKIDNLGNLTANIGTSNLYEIQLDVTHPMNGNIPGLLYWNGDDGTADLGLIGGNSTLQLGQKQNLYAKAGENITNGDVVYAFATLGSSGRIVVKKYLADGSVPAMFVMGVATEDILNGEDGYITISGKVKGLDTSMWAEETVLYTSPTVVGGYTDTPGVAPQVSMPLAIVINSHATNGTLYIRLTPPQELNELNDVYIDGVTDGEILVYNAVNQHWNNLTLAEAGISAIDHTHTLIDNDLSINGNLSATSITPNNLTTGYLPYKSATILVDSPFYTDGTNVGIGTGSPETKTHIQIGDVSTTYNTNDLLTIEDTSDANINIVTDSPNTGALLFSDESRGVGKVEYAHNGNSMRLYTASSERMRIDSSGNVGIGTTNPDTPLHVYHPTLNINAIIESGDANSYLAFKDSSTSDASSVYLGATGNNMDFHTGSSGAFAMRIDFSGNVGIGTTSPAGILDIRTASGGASMYLVSGGDTSSNINFGDTADDNIGQIRYFHTDNSFRFHTNIAEQMRITSTGNVGIGTVSPGAKLHLLNSGGATELIMGDTNTGKTWTNIGSSADTDGYFQIQHIKSQGSSFGDIVLNAGGGNVGIGTSSPSTLLHTNSSGFNTLTIESTGTNTDATIQLKDKTASWYFLNDESSSNLFKIYDGSNYPLQIENGASTNSLYIKSGGNVGIGTSSPNYKLEVNGTTYLGGSLTMAGSIIPSQTDTYDLGSSTKMFRKGWLSELDAILFAENTQTLLGGWFTISKNQGSLPTDIDSTQITIDFGKTLIPNDYVIFRGNLNLEYIKIGTLVSGTTYNVTRDLDGTGGNSWVAGSVFAVYGQEGDGRIELNAYDTPRISIINQGIDYNDQDEIVRIGYLDNYISSTYGTLSSGDIGIATKNFYAEGNVNIAGTLTAGDANGVGNTFYAGLIKNNLTTYSSDLTQWNNVLIAIETTEIESPNGEAIYKIIDNVGGTNNRLQKTQSLEAGTTYTLSVWVRDYNFDGSVLNMEVYNTADSQSFAIMNDINTAEWKRFSFTFTANLSASYAIKLFRFADVTLGHYIFATSPQLEISTQPTLYQPTDGILSSDTGYGMHSIAGGFGGTMQNPVIGLSSSGLSVLNAGTSTETLSTGVYIGNFSPKADLQGLILNNSGLYGYDNNATSIFHIDNTGAKLGGWDIDATKISATNMEIVSGANPYIGIGVSAYAESLGIWLGRVSGVSKMSMVGINGKFWWSGSEFIIQTGNGADIIRTFSDYVTLGNYWEVRGATSTGTIKTPDNSIVLDGFNKQISIKSTTYGTDGIQLDYNAGNPRAYIGNGSDRYFNFDGTNISWQSANTSLDTLGKLTTTSALIAGWTINSTDIFVSGKIWLNSASRYFALNNTTFGEDGIQLQYNSGNPRAYIGNGSDRYFNFDGTNLSWEGTNTSLTTAGLFTATNAVITGNITASTGNIAGWDIQPTYLSKTIIHGTAGNGTVGMYAKASMSVGTFTGLRTYLNDDGGYVTSDLKIMSLGNVLYSTNGTVADSTGNYGTTNNAHYGIQAIDHSRNILFELSDARNLIAGWTFTNDYIQQGSSSSSSTTSQIVWMRSADSLIGGNNYNNANTQTQGFGMQWHQSANAGIMSFGELMVDSSGDAITSSTGYDSGWYGLNAVDHNGNTYFQFAFDTTPTGGTVTNHSIAGWTFDAIKLYNGTDIVLDASNKKVSVYNDAVQMYYTSTTDYGIKDSAGKFKLGYANEIAGWKFDTSYLWGLASGTPTSSPSDGIVLKSGSTGGVTVYENTQKRIDLGYLSLGVYGLKGYADDGSTVVFELSDTQMKIGGFTLTDTKLYTASDNVVLDAASNSVSVAGGNVAMYYTSPTDYGIKDSAGKFQLGYVNQIAGWTIDSTAISSGNVEINSTNEIIKLGAASAFGSGTGILLGKDGTDYELYAGNGTQYIWWNGSTLVIKGDITGSNGVFSGTISADNITTGTIDASVITVTNLNASNITTGTIDASVITVTNLNASNITTGTLSANYISAGQLESTNWSTTLGSQLDLDNGTIKLGGSTSPKFSVSNIGIVTATDVDLTGDITANTGYFGGTTHGWQITSGYLTAIGTGIIRTGTDPTRMELDSTGLKGYNAGTQRMQILNDGSGWMGESDKFSWTDAGVVTISGWSVSADKLYTGTENNAGYLHIHKSWGFKAGSISYLDGEYLSGSGAVLGLDAIDSTSPVLFVGDSSNYIHFNSINAVPLTIKGELHATGGTLGAWNVNSTSIYSGTEDYNGFTLGGFTLYSNGTLGSLHTKNFYIDTSGNAFMKDITASGTMSGGSITGATITGGLIATGLTGATVALDSNSLEFWVENEYSVQQKVYHIIPYYEDSYGDYYKELKFFSNATELMRFSSENDSGHLINFYAPLIIEGSVSLAGTITGGVVQTSSSGQRIVMDSSTNKLSFIDSLSNVSSLWAGDYTGSYGIINGGDFIRFSSGLGLWGKNLIIFDAGASLFGESSTEIKTNASFIVSANIVNAELYEPTITVVGTTISQAVSVQVKDFGNNNTSGRKIINWWLTDAQNSGVSYANVKDHVQTITVNNGYKIESGTVAEELARKNEAVTDANGLFKITFTSTDQIQVTDNLYLHVEVQGKIITSPVIELEFWNI